MEDESIGVMSAWRSSSRVSTVFFGGILVFHVTTATRLRVARFAFRFFLAFLAKEKKRVTRSRKNARSSCVSRPLARGALGLLLASAEQAGGLRAPEREEDVDDHLELPHPLGPVGGGVERDVAEGQQGRDVERDGLLGEGVLGDAALEAAEHEQAEQHPDEAREEPSGREGVADGLQEVRELAEAVLAPDSARKTTGARGVRRSVARAKRRRRRRGRVRENARSISRSISGIYPTSVGPERGRYVLVGEGGHGRRVHAEVHLHRLIVGDRHLE